jgi:hydrogenase maturation protein HypF
MRVIGGRPVSLRRGRGQVPVAVKLPAALPPVLALGGHLKTSACVIRGDEAFLSQHVGDLDDPATLDFLAQTAAHMLAVLEVTPQAVACDLHPDFASGVLAASHQVRVVPVQHHHAHAAGVLAEHGHTGPALGLVLDGYGYGEDGGAWGGELLVLDGAHCTRIGGLGAIGLPGGDHGARQPWRMAAAALAALGRGDEIAGRFGDQPQARAVARLLTGGPPPLTSACGRWFDAAAGLLGLCAVQGFEAEAAMRLEAAAGDLASSEAEALVAFDSEGRLDPRPVFAALADCSDPRAGAALFHDALAAGLVALVARAAASNGINAVALSGGCLANARLACALERGLVAAGLVPLFNVIAPPGDGGLALGQAWIAALICKERC